MRVRDERVEAGLTSGALTSSALCASVWLLGPAVSHACAVPRHTFAPAGRGVGLGPGPALRARFMSGCMPARWKRSAISECLMRLSSGDDDESEQPVLTCARMDGGGLESVGGET